MQIDGRIIGPSHPVYVIAELSANHGQDFDQALALIRAAKAAGADAIKLQTYTPDTITLKSSAEHFRLSGGTAWDGRTLYDLYGEAFTPWDWQPRLKQAANELGLTLFSSPFDDTAVDFLEAMAVPAYKVASFELVDIPLIQRMARTGKPLIMSTGMASLAEIDDAVVAARSAGATEIALLKCTSAYPAAPSEMNLRTIPNMASAFGVPVGLSDHSMGSAVAVAAVALGACIVEKHLILSRETPGPDSAFSAEPQEFEEMVRGIRMVEQALGVVRYEPTSQEIASRKYRRSLFVVEDVKAGEEFTPGNIRSVRPGAGLEPKFLQGILGRRASHDIARGTPLSWSLVAGEG